MIWFEDAQFPPPKGEMAEIFPTMLDLVGFDGIQVYFPMQNLLKIKFRMSSFVVAPVISSSGRRAL